MGKVILEAKATIKKEFALDVHLGFNVEGETLEDCTVTAQNLVKDYVAREGIKVKGATLVLGNKEGLIEQNIDHILNI